MRCSLLCGHRLRTPPLQGSTSLACAVALDTVVPVHTGEQAGAPRLPRTVPRPPAGLLPRGRRPSARRVRAQRDEVLRILAETYPNITTMLAYRSGFELLVATVLAANCTESYKPVSM